MSVRAMSYVFERSRSEGVAKNVLLALADYCGEHEMTAYPSVASLARKCGWKRSAVIAALVELEESGRIVRAGMRGQVVAYRVVLDAPADAEPVRETNGSPQPDPPDLSVSRTGSRDEHVREPNRSPVRLADPPYSSGEHHLFGSRTQTVSEPSVNQQTDPAARVEGADGGSVGRSVWSDRFPNLARLRRLATEVLGRSFAAPAAEHAERLEELVAELPDGTLRDVLASQHANVGLRSLGGLADELEGAAAAHRAEEDRQNRPPARPSVLFTPQMVATLRPYLPSGWDLPAGGGSMPADDVDCLVEAIAEHKPEVADQVRRLVDPDLAVA